MQFRRIGLGIGLGILAMLWTATAAMAAPTVVNVRVEGATHTIFEAPVLTDGHAVTTASGGTHVCDGTNNGANPTPGATATAALDDAAAEGAFTWDGPFFPSFDDYLVSRIAGDTETATQFWGLLLNFNFTAVGGCQQRVAAGDQVLFAFDAFSKAHMLRLRGPHGARVGRPITVTVVDGQNGQPISGATVGPIGNTGTATTDANGRASVTFQRAGLKKLKAERGDSIRSDALRVLVLP